MSGSSDAAFASREPLDFPLKHPLGTKLDKLQEQMLCAICSELFCNPELLLCGHSFCSLCIRRHCDPTINRFTANVCPICRAKADTFDLRKNVTLAETVEQFRQVRDDLLALLESKPAPTVKKERAVELGSSSKGLIITGRLSQFNIHGMSKAKIQKVIEQATKDSRIKLRTEGDKDALERRLKDFVHLHNAQVGATNALTMDQVIEKINQQSLAMEKASSKEARTMASVEKLKNGEETDEFKVNFRKLAQIAMKAKKKKLAALTGTVVSEDSATGTEDEHIASEHLSQAESTLTRGNADIATEPTSMLWLDTVPAAERDQWQIIFSQKLQRHFYFHISSKTGQFQVPAALAPFYEAFLAELAASAEDQNLLVDVKTSKSRKARLSSSNNLVDASKPSHKRSRRAAEDPSDPSTVLSLSPTPSATNTSNEEMELQEDAVEVEAKALDDEAVVSNRRSSRRRSNRDHDGSGTNSQDSATNMDTASIANVQAGTSKASSSRRKTRGAAPQSSPSPTLLLSPEDAAVATSTAFSASPLVSPSHASALTFEPALDTSSRLLQQPRQDQHETNQTTRPEIRLQLSGISQTPDDRWFSPLLHTTTTNNGNTAMEVEIIDISQCPPSPVHHAIVSTAPSSSVHSSSVTRVFVGAMPTGTTSQPMSAEKKTQLDSDDLLIMPSPSHHLSTVAADATGTHISPASPSSQPQQPSTMTGWSCEVCTYIHKPDDRASHCVMCDTPNPRHFLVTNRSARSIHSQSQRTTANAMSASGSTTPASTSATTPASYTSSASSATGQRTLTFNEDALSRLQASARLQQHPKKRQHKSQSSSSGHRAH